MRTAAQTDPAETRISQPPRHRMLRSAPATRHSAAAARMHRRRGLSRYWLAQGGVRQEPRSSRREEAHYSPAKDQSLLTSAATGERCAVLARLCISLLLCSSIFYLPSSISASIITANLQTTSGNPYATNALFAPLSTPLASGSNTIASTPTNVLAAANGSLSVTLKQGNYLVTIGNLRRDSFVISVPNDANTYNLNSLITNALTFNYTFSPSYEQRVNKGQADGYVGLLGTTLTPNGLTASNFNLLGTINLGVAADNYATFNINENSSVYVQPGGAFTLSGDSSPRAEMFLHGTNAFIRFDEDAAINDSTATRTWKFNRFNVTSNNVATVGEATNIVNSLGTVPVGAILAWDKSLTGVPSLPANFVECNGQTISDAASPLNGQTIRNLNGNNQFLRGNATSGGSGGASTHTHNFTGITDIENSDFDVQNDSGSAVTVAAASHTHSYAGVTDSANSLPPYMDMVWVMRIK